MKEKTKIFISIMLLSMFLLSYLVITPIVALIYRSFDNISLQSIQLIVTLIPLFSVITMFSCDPLTKKVSMKNISFLGLILIILGALLTLIIHNSIIILYISSILLGLGIGLVNVISSTMISYYFNGKEKMQVMGYQSVFVSIGGSLFSYLSGLLSNIHWSYSYLCFLLAIIVIILMTLWLPNDKLIKEKSDDKKTKLPKRIYWLGLISILFFISINVFNTSISLLVENIGLSSYISGIVTSIYTIIGILAGLLLSKIVKIFQRQTLTFACLLACIGLFILGIANNICLIIIGTILVGFSFATRNPAGITCSANMVSAKQSAFAIAIFNGCGQLGSFLSPFVLKNNVFISASILMLIVTLLHYFFNPIKKDDL